jgi:adenylate cyclase
VAVSLLVGGTSLAPALSRLDGLSIDFLFWLRHAAFGTLHGPEDSQVAIIGIDEETYRRAPFMDVPKALWTPSIARVVEAALAGGGRVIGQDLVLPTSVESFLQGHDRDYLLALRAGAREGRVVLGQVQHLAKPITPHRGHAFAVGGGKNLRIVNLFREDDGIIRRVPVTVTRLSEGREAQSEPTFAMELAARAMDAQPELSSTGDLQIGPARIPSNGGRGMLVNFAGGGHSLPVHSFADLAACADAGDAQFFQKAFDGKVVIFGVVLDVEDRKLTSARYVTGPDGAWFAERCRLPVMDELYGDRIVRETIPGTFIFATAVNDILRKTILREVPPSVGFLIVVGAALLASWATLHLPIFGLAGAFAAGVVAWVGAATWSFQNLLVIPLLDPIAAALAAAGIMLSYRFAVTDRARRQVRQAFSYYLPEAEVDRVLAQDQAPELGGEIREVTIYMSDVVGFTKLCEGLGPSETVQMMNAYFSAATEIIEAHHGCVYMYIGDAIVAIFGAPLEDEHHARHAVEAALAFRDRTQTLGADLWLAGGATLEIRAGIATGPALIGNIGSPRRLNYTAMGDTARQLRRCRSSVYVCRAGMHRLISTCRWGVMIGWNQRSPRC